MASVVRIKRRLSLEPAEALLLAASCKKFKGEGAYPSHENPHQNVFKFCGTVDNKEEDVKTITRIVENGKMKSHRSLHWRMNRKDRTTLSASFPKEKRYKMLSIRRSLEECESESSLKIYDLVCEGEVDKTDVDVDMCNGVPSVVGNCSAKPEKDVYVYDYYYSEVGTIDETYLDQLMSVQPFQSRYESESEDDSDDSNAEDNDRNDYPDTEEDNSDMKNLVYTTRRVHLGDSDSDELSSEHEDSIYNNDDKNVRSYHSTVYSAYKKRFAKHFNSETDEDSDSEDSNSEDSEGWSEGFD